MFYSKEILTRKKGGFGIIWLAATLGSRSSLRKLSKKEVNSVNLVKACEYVTTPPEPLALRLTSNLMIGITRVYHQQYHFYYIDVNGVWNNLQKALVEMRSKESVDMMVPQARHEAITLEDDPFFEIELNIPMRDIMLPLNVDNQIEFTQFPSSDAGTIRSSNNSRRSLITLPDVEAGFAASSGGFSNVDGFVDDDVLMIDDSGIRIDFDAEGGLHEFVTQPEGQQDKINEQQQIGDTNVKAIDNIIKRVRDEHKAGLEQGRANKRRKRNGPINDEGLQKMEEDNVQYRDINVEPPSNMEIEPPNIEDIGPPNIEDIGPPNIEDIEPPVMRNIEEMQQQIPDEEQDNVNKENVPDRQPEQSRRNRRKIRIMIDEETELTNEQILAMRQEVIDDLDKAEIVAREKMRMQENKRQLDNILYTPGKSFLAPQLASLWEQHCAPMLYDENVRRRGIQPLSSVINLNERDERDILNNDIDLGGSNIPRGVRDSSIRSDEPERLRKEGSQQSSAIMSGMENSGFDKYPEIDHFFDQNSFVGGSADINIDLLGQLRSGGGRNLDSMGFNAPSIDLSDRMSDDNITFPIFGDLPLFDSSSQVREGQFTNTVINSEQEATNFFESIKMIMNDAQVSIAIFQDIMETQHVRRVDVARNFYYILALANRNLIKVNQLQEYADIMIQIRNE